MSDQTTNLSLTWLAPGQAQKHVSVNESLRRLDALVQLSAVSATTAAEPASPTDGEVYIVPAGKSGTHWSAYANGALAYYRDGAWEEISPREGWQAWVKDAGRLVVFNGSVWATPPAAGAYALTGDISASVSSDQDDFNPAGLADASVIRLDVSGFIFLTGLAGGAHGRIVTLINVGSGEAQISHESSGSAAANRFALPSGGYTELQPGVSVTFIYDATSSRWRLIGKAFFYGTAVYRDTGTSGSVVPLLDGANTWSGAQSFSQAPLPASDNSIDLGTASLRFRTLYAGTGTINTSDAREKTPLRLITDAERRAIRRVIAGIGVFQWREAVTNKGDAARLHAGVTAQALAQAFAAEGLDPARYGLWCSDPTPEGDRLGIRYDQLFTLGLATLAI